MKTRTLSSPHAIAKTRGYPTITVTDTRRTPDPAAMAMRLPRGGAMILRHYDASNREILAQRISAICQQRGLTLLVAGDWRLAAAVKADGLHLPEGLARHGVLAPALLWRRRCGAFLTTAAHGRNALTVAARLRADAALLSPVFPTASHPGDRTLGPWRTSLWARKAAIPILALGGMNQRKMRRLAGVVGWAGTGLA